MRTRWVAHCPVGGPQRAGPMPWDQPPAPTPERQLVGSQSNRRQTELNVRSVSGTAYLVGAMACALA